MQRLARINSGSQLLCLHTSCRLQSVAIKGSKVSGDASEQQNVQNAVRKPRAEDFRHAKVGNFVQERPRLKNQYVNDPLLRAWLRETMPKEVLSAIEPDLIQFGDQVVGEMLDWHAECDRDPPRLQQYDAWGNRVDQIISCGAWKRLQELSAREGLIANAYEKKFGQYSRVYQMAKLYLFFPSGKCCLLMVRQSLF